MAPRIKDSELKSLLAEMEEDLQKAYDISKENLIKAADEEEITDLQDEARDSPEDLAPEAPADTAPVAAPTPEEGAQAPGPEAGLGEEAPPQEDPAAALGEEAPQDPAAEAGPGLTKEALQAEYSQLSPEELDLHLHAAMAAKVALSGMGGEEAPPQEDPAAAEGGFPPPGPEAGLGEDPLVQKSEKKNLRIDALEQLVKTQSEDIELLTKSIKMVVERPVRKAITSISYLQKGEEAKKAPAKPEDIKHLIKENAHKLSKKEHRLILDFYDRRITAAELAPVLEKLTD